MDELILVDPWGVDKLILVKLMPKFKFNPDDYLLDFCSLILKLFMFIMFYIFFKRT